MPEPHSTRNPQPTVAPKPVASSSRGLGSTLCGKKRVSVGSQSDQQYLAARTKKYAAVCLHAARIGALWEFWTDWLPTETPYTWSRRYYTQELCGTKRQPRQRREQRCRPPGRPRPAALHLAHMHACPGAVAGVGRRPESPDHVPLSQASLCCQ